MKDSPASMKREPGIRSKVAPKRGSSQRDGRAEELHEHEVIWGNNPNNHYFAYFIENRRNAMGKIDDGSTLEEILAGPRKALAARQVSGSLASELEASSVHSTVPSEMSVSSEAQTHGDQDLVPVPAAKRLFTPPQKSPRVRPPPIAEHDTGSESNQAELPPFIYVGDSPLTVRVQREDEESGSNMTAKPPEGHNQYTTMILLVALIFCLFGIAIGVLLYLRSQE
jgi:hypothetical protein